MAQRAQGTGANMDVSLRLSLQGGHHWQFVCDEDDPMVFGLVSALPGATLDGSLPPDGLIQVEARNGERLFMSRSSLVDLTINRLPTPTQASTEAPQPPQGNDTAFLASTPFVMRGDVFDPLTIKTLLTTSASRPSANVRDVQDVDVDALPAAAVEALVRVLSSARTYLTAGRHDETHLDLRICRVPHVAPVRLPLRAKSPRLLDFVIWLSPSEEADAGMAVSLPDRWVGRADDATPTVRTLPLAPNTALVFPAANGLETLDLHISADAGRPTVVSGSLCEGSGIESR